MTNGLAYLAALALAILFVYSAIMKFRDPRPTRRALDAAGLPGSRAIATAVCVVELIIAATLVVRPSLGAALALGLLGSFTLFVVYLLVRKIDVSCGCFGASASDSVSEVDVVRNGLMMAVAVLATTISRPSAVALEEIIAVTTTAAICVVGLAAIATRHRFGQPNC